MSKELLVQALRQSVRAFEEERKKHPGDLDLSGTDLSGCDLKGVQLGRANLQGVNFSGADLTGANLSHADLRGARFHGAKVVGVNLHKVVLQGTDFRGAILGGFEDDGRICINQGMFQGVRWGKQQLEYLLNVLNQNEEWEIRYEVVPRKRPASK